MSSSQINTLPDSTSLRSKAFIPAKLPDDFLRVKLNPNQLPATYHQHRQLRQQSSLPQQLNQWTRINYRGKLQIKFIEARLNKNYGLTRMDCYIKFNLNGKVFETDTDYSCGKNPKWNKTIIW
jgi:toll-interacting protein